MDKPTCDFCGDCPPPQNEEDEVVCMGCGQIISLEIFILGAYPEDEHEPREEK